MTAINSVRIPGVIVVRINILATSRRRLCSTSSSTSTISPIGSTIFPMDSDSHAVGGNPHKSIQASLWVGRISWDHF
ncbi:hypothetical protein JHK82_053376 [Glycine max]|nr:hypothetical protein JHK86_053225 [Glycine max]KAG4915737.1 hypothetical protein JHK87_053294 [Glycine soja]KAG4927678.1 hypothetical protein JHK85_054164 [Glycine max]KAG5083207.1 hypothetical protein JHK84_053245 [Glycine max]KAG5085979.1 hypothetical protein JHK82_053376 [Glycine max]